tara:strand:+ start:1432 stop:3522 length:2091 start_codon:yes stop_codon:yes gene_type:complete
MSVKKELGWEIGVDIGGTFTDIVLRSSSEVLSTKVLTSSEAPVVPVISGIKKLVGDIGISLNDINRVVHGTTLATNAIIEKKGVKTAFITTEGFRDVIEMRTESRFDQYDLNIQMPPPLITRDKRFTISERLSATGEKLINLNKAEVHKLISILEKEKFESIAIGFLHAHVNPIHELTTKKLIRKALPTIPISISSEVSPEIREYERFTTTCVNAYIQPVISPYLGILEKQLRLIGIGCPIFLMLSNGGLSDVETGKQFPVRMVESGPAGGAILAGKISKECKLDKVVSFDMGGTTAKVCLLDDGNPDTAREFEVARQYRFKRGSGIPIRIPVIEMVEIGAGGGSVCKIDEYGRILVGPESAGSDPGPACYGKGGLAATITDANVILNRINPQIFAGGKLKLSSIDAKNSFESALARPLDEGINICAAGAVEMVDENMANAAREHAMERGKSLLDRTIIAFGGSAPLHAVRLAQKLGIKKIIIPANAGVGSAVGFLDAPITYETTRSFYQRLSLINKKQVSAVLAKLEVEARKVVERVSSSGSVLCHFSAYMRFVGQRHEIKIRFPSSKLTSSSVHKIRDNFLEAYRSQYSQTMPNVDMEVVGWSVTAFLKQPRIKIRSKKVKSKGVRPQNTRNALDFITGKNVEHNVYSRKKLAIGSKIIGPAIIEEDQTTTLIPKNFAAQINGYGYLVIEEHIT